MTEFLFYECIQPCDMRMPLAYLRSSGDDIEYLGGVDTSLRTFTLNTVKGRTSDGSVWFFGRQAATCRA